MGLTLFLLCAALTSNANPCSDAIQAEILSVYDLLTGNSSDYSALQRTSFSGRDINDLGHFESCGREPGSVYVLLRIWLDKNTPTAFGLCVPEECDGGNFMGLIPQSMSNQVRVEVIDLSPGGLGWKGYSLIFFTGVLLLLVAYGTILGPQRTSKVATCFSLVKNYEALTTEKINDNTKIFNGVRVLSILWIILGHSYVVRAGEIVVNLETIPYLVAQKGTIMAYGAYFAVDVFFWLGGFLLCYLWLVNLESANVKISIPFAIFRRLIRILPMYLFVVFFATFVITEIVSGPKWPFFREYITGNCEEYWWTNALFINNFYPGIGLTGMCLGHTWYLASDMQFFIVFSFIVYLYYKASPVIFWLLFSVLVVFGVAIRGYFSFEYDYYLADIQQHKEEGPSQSFDFYMKPYIRFLPYMFGIATGAIYFAYKMESSRDSVANYIIELYNRRKVFSYLSFVLGVLLFDFMIWTEYYCFSDRTNEYKGFSQQGNAIVLTIQKLILALSFTFMSLPLLFGKLTLITQILSLKFWSPLAKLTYSIYLLHLVVQVAIVCSEKYGTTVTVLSIYLDFVFYLAVIIPLALFLHLVIEAPTRELLQLALRRNTKENSVLPVKEFLLEDIKST